MSDPETRRFSLFPKRLGDCVEPLTRPALKPHGLAGSRILTEWPSIVGPALSAHCHPESLSFPRGKKTGGTLAISCENGFATEIFHLQPVILERMARYFGYQAVARISISHSWARPAPPEARPRPAPRLTAADCRCTDAVEDAELRDALASLGRALAGET